MRSENRSLGRPIALIYPDDLTGRLTIADILPQTIYPFRLNRIAGNNPKDFSLDYVPFQFRERYNSRIQILRKLVEL